jgi:hypothetical protein
MARDRIAAARAAAARAETSEPESRTIDFRGLELTLPATMPGAVLFDVGLVDEKDIVGMMRLLDSLIGREQYLQVRAKVAEDGLDVETVAEPLGELINDAFGAYGMKPGEAQASSGS